MRRSGGATRSHGQGIVAGAVLAVVLLAAAGVTAGCASAEAAQRVAVRLENLGEGRMAITLEPSTVTAGPVTFDIENVGTMIHEVEVFVSPDGNTVLPVVANVADTSGLTLVDEVEDILPGASTTLTMVLDPGLDLVICNLPGHYAAGMVALLTVVPSG